MYYKKQILGFDINVKGIWKIVTNEMGKYSAVEESLSIKMKNNILKSPKHIRNL
jgi:hypothetical protein